MKIASQVDGQNKLLAWVKAARLPSLLYILSPIVLGQFFAYSHGQKWYETIFILSLFYGVFLQLFIVFANDLADFETDKLNESSTIFSGGSRVLVEGLLTLRELTKGAFLCLGLTVFFAAGLSYLASNPIVFFLGLVGPLFLWLYSYGPYRLSYRGGGELLQALGLSFVLPFFGFFLQGSGDFLACTVLCAALFPSQLACAMSTAIPDAISDSQSNKKTFVVLLGPMLSFLAIFLLHSLSYGLMLFFLSNGLIFGGVTHSFLGLILPQFILTASLLMSFFKRSINSFVFFSIAHILYLLFYCIYLSL